MCKKAIFLVCALSIVVPLLLTCTSPKNPFNAENATISVVLENSKRERNTELISDTVGLKVRVGVSGFLPQYIKSISIAIVKGTTDTDTVVTFPKPVSETDTQWLDITFRSPGSRTVYATASIDGAPNYSLVARINVAAGLLPVSAVTYNGNGNTGGTVPVDNNSYEQGTTVTVKANTGTLVRSSYTFAGWNTKADGSGTSYAGGETFTMGNANITLFAKWTQKPTYTISYNGNGNTGGTVPTDANVYEEGALVTISANTGTLVRTGYTFAGWNSAADGNGTSYAGAATLTMGNTNIVVFAKWTQNATYTVTYNGNGNTGGTAPIDANVYEQGASVTVKANTGTMTLTGSTFTGWNTAADGSGTSYASGDVFNIKGANVTLFAKWTKNPTYTITYNGNGNTSGSVPSDVNAYLQGATVTVKANTGNLIRTSYTFAGWNTAADGSGTSYAAAATFTMGTANVTLYAKWTQNPTYTVTYSGNGNTTGAAPTDVNAYEQGTSVTVKANTGNLSQTSYTFAGWNTMADGTGTTYAGAATFTMGSANITLYAKWTQNPTYTVTYNGNGNTSGTVPTDANTYEQGNTVTIKTNAGSLARTSYTFAGWNTAADGSGSSYAEAATLTMGSANITLYAKWTQNSTYTVTYNGNGNTGGTAPTDANAYQQGVTVTVSGVGTLVRTGYAFAGWNTAADGSGVSYGATATFAMGSSNVTLYAIWTMGAYSITYNLDGGTNGNNPSTYTVTSATITLVSPTKTGFTFGGWFTNSGLTGTAETTIPIGSTGNKEYWAKWTINSYTVTFNSNGGSAVTNQNVAYNGTATTPTPAPTYAGYTFAGWYSDAALTILFTFTTPITAATTLYAKWTPVYTVTYNGNSNTSGTVPTDANKYTNGTTVSVLENTGSLARTGYTFTGWNTNAAGTGTDRTTGSTFTIGSANVTLYAKWTINQNTVSFVSNGGSAVTSQTVNYGSTASQPTAPTKTSYVFAGWYSNSQLTAAFAFTTAITANITLYAKWEIRDADGNVYTEVTIGTQTWMVENLKTTKYNDGTPIPLVTDSAAWANLTTPAYCWFNNDASYKNPYGALYTWYAAISTKLAPPGWHVPSDDEWMTLINAYGGLGNAGGPLKETGTTHWRSPNSGATNSSGFTGLPGSTRYYGGVFAETPSWSGVWWTTFESPYDNTRGRFYGLYSDNVSIEQYSMYKNTGMSVRCIKN